MIDTLPPIAMARAHLEGALDALTTLHEDLILRRDEARNEAAREAYDEELTLLEALQAEYHRRRDALPSAPPHHASFVFLLTENGEVHPLPHDLYVALARGAAAAPEFAGRTLRLAEWYVRLRQGEPETVVDEHYGYLAFDRDGRIDWSATPRPDDDALPTPAERERLQEQVFGGGRRSTAP